MPVTTQQQIPQMVDWRICFLCLCVIDQKQIHALLAGLWKTLAKDLVVMRRWRSKKRLTQKGMDEKGGEESGEETLKEASRKVINQPIPLII